MKYLVCVDGSDFGDAAFERAKELYVSGRDMLVIVLVHSDDDSKRSSEKEVIQRYAKVCNYFLIILFTCARNRCSTLILCL